MPTIYLSPSTQEANLYVTGGSEEYWMNQLADRMEPYLRASGIGFVRNTPQMTAAGSIRASNAGSYDLHLALHSNAAPEGRYGEVTWSVVFYYPGSEKGLAAARAVAEGLRAIYPGEVQLLPNRSLGELRRVKAPSVFIELAYHDNEADADWITENLDLIVAVLTDFVSAAAYQHVDYIFDAAFLFQFDDTFERCQQFVGGLDALFRMEAIVAVAAVLYLVCLAKVVQKQFAAAD